MMATSRFTPVGAWAPSLRARSRATIEGAFAAGAFALLAVAVSAQTPVPSHAPTAPAPPRAGRSGATKAPPVAYVNGVELRADRLKSAMNEVMPYGAYHAGAPSDRIAAIRTQALDRIIDEELQYQEAKRLRLNVTQAAVDAEYSRVRRRYKTRQEYLSALRAAGITTADVRAEARRRALIAAAHREVVAPKCGVDDGEAQRYYEENLSKFVMPEQRRIFTLTLGVDPSSPRDEWDATRRRAEDLKAQLARGADFSVLAREHSTDPNKENGGDLGYVHQGRLSEEFERALAGAAPGTVVGPVETIYGFHLLEVGDLRPPVQRTFSEVRERLVKDLQDKKCAETRDAWLRDLRARAKIVIADTAAEPGAARGPSPER